MRDTKLLAPVRTDEHPKMRDYQEQFRARAVEFRVACLRGPALGQYEKIGGLCHKLFLLELQRDRGLMTGIPARACRQRYHVDVKRNT